jgi:replication factor C subunit 2/4
MMRLLEVVERENLVTSNDGLEAIIFTAQGDMRQVVERANCPQPPCWH